MTVEQSVDKTTYTSRQAELDKSQLINFYLSPKHKCRCWVFDVERILHLFFGGFTS